MAAPRRTLAFLLLASPAASLAAPASAQGAGVVDLDPTPPAVATYPTFVDVAATLAGPGTVVDDQGTGRGHAWVDVVGPDPSDPSNPSKIGPPDGVLDLVQTNSNSPELPLGAPESEWLYAPVAATSDPCAVYRAAPDGTLTDVTALMMPGATEGFDLRYPSASPWGTVAGDYDGDGDQDLFYPCGAFNLASVNALMRNNGDGTFDNVGAAAGMVEEQSSYGATWFDYDRDGDLDLYQTNAPRMFAAGWQGPDLVNPIDRLYRNAGDGTFDEVGEEAGVALTSGAFAVAVSDLDRNGWLDLVVSCHRRYNKVFYNDGDGTFSFMAPEHNTDFDLDMEELLVWTPQGKDKDFAEIPPEWDVLPLEGRLSIPVELQDFNGDGWTDILYGCWSLQIGDDEVESAVGAFFEPWDRAYFYLNLGDQDGDGLGDGLFREVAEDVGLGHVGGVMGMIASDFNGDGYPDVFMGGGGPDLLANLEEDYLYINEGTDWPANFQADPQQPLGQMFYEVGALAGTYENIHMAHGVTAVRGGSGRIDMMVANGGPAFFQGGQPNYYFQNEGNIDGSTPNVLEVALAPTVSSPGAYGARVEVVASEGGSTARATVQERRSGIGFSSHNDGPLLFGLGGGGALAVNVEWPSGVRSGEILFPANVSATDVELDEPTLSFGVDVEPTAAGAVSVALAIEETGAATTLAVLWFFVVNDLGGGNYTSLALPLGPALPLAPGVPIELGGTAPFLPEGLYGFAAIDASSGAILNAGSVWHDPAAALASAPSAASVAAAVLAPEPDPAEAPRARSQRLADVAQRLSFRAHAVAVAPARMPLAWETVTLVGEGQRALDDGSILRWSGGAATLELPAHAEMGTLSFQNEHPTVSLDLPTTCCRKRPDAVGVYVRLIDVEGEIVADGRAFAADGVPVGR